VITRERQGNWVYVETFEDGPPSGWVFVKYLGNCHSLASSASGAVANTHIPAKFRGEWCTNIDEKSNIYKPCKDGYVPEGSFMVQPTRLSIAGEVGCKVIRGEPRTNGYYVTAQCVHVEGDKWVYRSLLSRQGARLFVKDDSPEGNGPLGP
jgi:hypothetical protein